MIKDWIFKIKNKLKNILKSNESWKKTFIVIVIFDICITSYWLVRLGMNSYVESNFIVKLLLNNKHPIIYPLFYVFGVLTNLRFSEVAWSNKYSVIILWVLNIVYFLLTSGIWLFLFGIW